MNIKKVITAMCATTFIFASSFNNVNINNINAVAEGVIEEHVDYSDGITYGTYDCGDCVIEYSVGTNRIVVRSITHVEDKDEVELNIPAYINGIPVTIIKDRFAGGMGNNITSVVIPDTVTYIGNEAFRDCHSLKEIKIPDSVTSIGEFAFFNCSSLESVKLSNNIKELSCTFEGCENLKSVTIPESVSYINGAFGNCLNLKSLIIPESVEAFIFNFDEYYTDIFSLTILSDNLHISSTYGDDTCRMFDSIYGDRMKIYAHENSTVYNAYKYECYNRYRDNQEEYENALSKFNIIENDTDIDDDTQWYTIMQSPDVNNDGRIDASDASDILKYYAYVSTGGELSFEDFTALKE